LARVLAYGCLHAPITDPGFFNWLIGQIEQFRPTHLVNLGDWFEGLAAKRWDKHPEEKWDLEDEINAVLSQARAFNEAAPHAHKIWLYGNHDANLFNEPHRINEDLRRVMAKWKQTYSESAHLESWEIIDKYGHRAKKRIGPLTLQHGGNTGKSQAQSYLKDQAYMYGVPWGLHVSAHTHEPVQVTQCRERTVYMPYWYANVGTGADWDRMFYMNRSSMETWGRACVCIEVSDAAIKHRKPAYAGREWDAETRIHSYASLNRAA
jgi:hypothetical protein